MAKQKIMWVTGPGFSVRFFFVSDEITNRIISIGQLAGFEVSIRDVEKDEVYPSVEGKTADIFLM